MVLDLRHGVGGFLSAAVYRVGISCAVSAVSGTRCTQLVDLRFDQGTHGMAEFRGPRNSAGFMGERVSDIRVDYPQDSLSRILVFRDANQWFNK